MIQKTFMINNPPAESRVFILPAAGEAQRWESSRSERSPNAPAPPWPKQLAPLPGHHTVLGRLIQQALAAPKPGDHVPVVVTHREDIAKVANDYAVRTFQPARRERLAQTLLSTVGLWADRTIVLLGDVVFYTPMAFRVAVDSSGDLEFFGTRFELFGLTFMRSQHKRLIAALHKADAPRAGKLWHILRVLSDVPMEHHSPDEHGQLLQLVLDGSNDMDTYTDYEEMCRAMHRG